MWKNLVVKLDRDVRAGLKELDAEDRADLNTFANEALRDAIFGVRRRRELHEWIYGLNEEHGHPTTEQKAAAQEFWDEVCAMDPSDAPTP
jgi:hypothetical protein